MPKITDWKWQTRFMLGTSPSLFYPAYRTYYRLNTTKLSNSGEFTTKKTQIVIEGFPRSANSSTVAHFQSLNPQIAIAHHHHVPAQVIQGVNWRLPTLVLIRQPEDAIASFKCLQPGLSLTTAIKGYNRFYGTLLPYVSSFLIAPFDHLFEDFAQIIHRINQKFSCDFCPGIPLQRHQTNSIEKSYYLDYLRQPRYQLLMTRAFDLYQTYLILELQSHQNLVPQV
jgi:hypothetical protein